MKNKKEFCISVIRSYLQNKKISFKEIEADSGTMYFRLLLPTSAPCLRLADHPHGKRKPSVTIYWMVGTNAKNKHLKHRIEMTIDKMIRVSKIGTTLGTINRLENMHG